MHPNPLRSRALRFLCLTVTLAGIAAAAVATPRSFFTNVYEPPASYKGWDMTHVRPGRLPYKVIFYGDSIMSGYGLAEPAKKSVTAIITKDFTRYNYVDRGVLFKDLSDPNETTANAVTRIKQAIALKPDVIVFAIGTNDALRGVDPDVVYNNLEIILRDLSRSGVYTMFVGMQATADKGYNYLSKFNSTYAKLAQKYNVVFLPYLKQGVSGNRMLNQRDGIYPNAEGAVVVAQNVSHVLTNMFKQLKKYNDHLDDIVTRRKYMETSNKGAAARGLPPRYTQQEIDAAGQEPAEK